MCQTCVWELLCYLPVLRSSIYFYFLQVDVKELPEPVTLQCVQTDGRLFHFAVFQLNTLDLDDVEGKKNIFWMLPRIPLFSSCMYVKGKPLIEGYSPEVFSRLLAFCSNGLQSHL
jgi:Mitochondrial 28S ribosomal protein S30 (PDCD9).